MVHSDSYTPEQKLFECNDCRYRMASDEHQPRCPRCGGEMSNIAVTRE